MNATASTNPASIRHATQTVCGLPPAHKPMPDRWRHAVSSGDLSMPGRNRRDVYGDKWVAAADPLAIPALAWPFWLMNNLSGAVLAALSWLGHELKIQTAALLITGLFIFLALPYGTDGGAWAIVGAAIFSSFAMQYLALKCLKEKWRVSLRALVPAVMLSTILGVALYVLEQALPALWTV